MCQQCQTNPVYIFTNKRQLCKRCFINWFEKKFLYTIRKFKLIQQNDIITYQKSTKLKNVVLEKLLQMFSEKSRIQLLKFSTKKKYSKIAITTSTDDEAQEILKILMNSNAKKLETFGPIYKKTIKPFYIFLDCEILLYAKIKKLKFKTPKIKPTKISKFINDLEKKHPEIKRAIINGYLELYN